MLHVKIGVQLLGIQIRLEQLHGEKDQLKMSFDEKDRHLGRISEVFSEKNYNVTALKRILREDRELLECDH